MQNTHSNTYIEKIAGFKKYENDELIEDRGTQITYDGENLKLNIHNNYDNYTVNLSNNDLDEFVQVLFANHAHRMPLMQRLSHDFNMPSNKIRGAKEFRLHNPLQQYIRNYSKRRTCGQRQRDRGLSQGHNLTLKKLQSNSPDDVLKTITSLANI